MRSAGHLAKAKYNVESMEAFHAIGRSDWAASAAFYALYHGLLAILAREGYESRNQSCTFALVRDLIASLYGQGFRRVVVVNGHGGNAPSASVAVELMAEMPELQVKFHNWWNAPRTLAFVKALEPASSHASWMENLPWTRLAEVAMPATVKPPVDGQRCALLNPWQARDLVGDGNFGGSYARSVDEVLKMWTIAVEETRELIDGPWRQ